LPNNARLACRSATTGKFNGRGVPGTDA